MEKYKKELTFGLLNWSPHFDFDPHLLGNYLNSQWLTFLIRLVDIITSILLSALRIKWNNVKNVSAQYLRINDVSFFHVIFFTFSGDLPIMSYMHGLYTYQKINAVIPHNMYHKIKFSFASLPSVAKCMVINKWYRF